MSAPRLLFDENFGRPLVRAMAQLLAMHSEKPEIRSILDLFEQGTDDDIWIPRLAQEEWIVVTCDRAKRSGGKKLPALCKQHGITHVLVSATLHAKKQFEKARAVVTVFPDLLASFSQPKGSRYILRFTGISNNAVLVPCIEPNPKGAPA